MNRQLLGKGKKLTNEAEGGRSFYDVLNATIEMMTFICSCLLMKLTEVLVQEMIKVQVIMPIKLFIALLLMDRMESISQCLRSRNLCYT